MPISLRSLSSCLAACLLREGFPDPLSTCIQFTVPSQTCDYLTSCNTTLQNSRIGIKDYLGQKLAKRMWKRYVHALSGGSTPVYKHSSLSARLCCLHLLAHSNRLGAGLSTPTARTALGWMDGGCSKGQVQVPLLYVECSLAAHFLEH